MLRSSEILSPASGVCFQRDEGGDQRFFIGNVNEFADHLHASGCPKEQIEEILKIQERVIRTGKPMAVDFIKEGIIEHHYD